jgi:transposase
VIFLREINPVSAKLLERIYRSSKHHQVRQRAHCLILASQGLKVEELMQTFQVSYKTIYNWFERWESEGMVGLYNQPGQGRKPTFSWEQKSKIREWVAQEPRQLKKVVQKVKQEWGIEISTRTIKRILTMFYMSWHRMRRGVGGEPNPEEYKRKKAELEELKRKDCEGEINLYYLDESGFSLIPSVPYAWQNIGEYLTINSQRSRRLNVLGILNRTNDLKAYVSLQSINSDVVIACIDTFFPTVDKPTVIVVDQSSIHISDAIQDKLPEWQERGLSIFVLPSYSPQLNLIEILWRFIKYEWIEIDAYTSWKTFVASVERILREFGKKHVINFV